MLGHDVADDVGWHIRPVASQVLADAGDQCFLVAVTLVHGGLLVTGIGQSVGVSEGLVWPLKDEALPCGWHVQLEHLHNCGVQLMAVVLLDEPLAASVALDIVVPTVWVIHPVVQVAGQDTHEGVDPLIPELVGFGAVRKLIAWFHCFLLVSFESTGHGRRPARRLCCEKSHSGIHFTS